MTTTDRPSVVSRFGDELPSWNTARLRIRPFSIDDAAHLQRLVGERAIADTTLNIPHPYKDGMAEAWITTHKSAFESHETVTLAVEEIESGLLVGAIAMHMKLKNESAEIGYWIGEAYWGRGYCTEAGFAMLDYAFHVLELNRVHASHLTRNPASGRVMQKLGMTHEGRLREHVRKWDVFEDIDQYGILRREYLAARG